MSELKPCPFCGSEVQDDVRGEKYPKKLPIGLWIVRCECCGASMSQFRKSGKDEISWNTRPIEDALNARIAELEAELAKMKKHFRQPTHGPCCTCQRCGQPYEDCRCDLDDVVYELEEAHARIAELEGKIDQLTAHSDIERQDDKWIPEVQE